MASIKYTARLPLQERLELFEKAIILYKEKRWSAFRISKELKISKGTVADWIHGRYKPSEERFDLRKVNQQNRINAIKAFWSSERGEIQKQKSRERMLKQKNPFYGKHHTKEFVKRLGEIHKNWIPTQENRKHFREAGIRRWKNNPEYRKSQTEHLNRISETCREKRIYYIKIHEKEVEKQLFLMEKQGFRAINVSISAKKPDIIAFKDGKIYAVEVETLRRRKPNYVKWEKPNPFDDIIWIIKEAT